MAALRRVVLLAWKDLVVEARSKELLGAMFVFALLVVVIFSFGLDPARSEVRPLFPGILWVAVFFAGVLGLNRSFTKELEDHALWGMMLVPMDRSTVFYAKALSNLLLLLFTEAIVLPLFFVLLGQTLPGGLHLFLAAILLGSVGFTLAGHPPWGPGGRHPVRRDAAPRPALSHPGAGGLGGGADHPGPPPEPGPRRLAPLVPAPGRL